MRGEYECPVPCPAVPNANNANNAMKSANNAKNNTTNSLSNFFSINDENQIKKDCNNPNDILFKKDKDGTHTLRKYIDITDYYSSIIPKGYIVSLGYSHYEDCIDKGDHDILRTINDIPHKKKSNIELQQLESARRNG